MGSVESCGMPTRPAPQQREAIEHVQAKDVQSFPSVDLEAIRSPAELASAMRMEAARLHALSEANVAKYEQLRADAKKLMEDDVAYTVYSR